MQQTATFAALMALLESTSAGFLFAPVVVSIEMGSAAAWAGAAGGIAGGTAGTVTAIENSKKRDVDSQGTGEFFSHVKRQDYGTQLAWEECRDDVGSATIGFQVPSPGNLLVTGMPATCMTLSTTITGKFNEGNPTPMGSDSIQFNNVGQDTIDEIVAALKARGD